MSGLEALATLGLACNIMQVISFARETAEICSTVFQTGSVDPSLTTTVAHLTKAFGELDSSLAAAPAPLTSDDDELCAIAKACLVTAKKLDDEVRKVSSANSKGNHARAVLVGLKTKLQGKIEKMEKSLAAHQGTLQTRLLLQIYKTHGSVLVEQQGNLGEIDSSLRSFMDALARGETDMAHLIDRRSIDVKEHVTTEMSKVQETVKAQAAELASDEQHKQLLHSLKYETMNERRNQIAESHEETFHWIFGCPPENQSDPSDSSDLPNLSNLSNSGDSGDSFGLSSRSECDPDDPPDWNECDWDDFPDWLRSSEKNLYWLSGKAGSGKSSLVKFLVQDLRTTSLLNSALESSDTSSRPPDTDTLILSHFLWSASQQPLGKNIKGLLCSLLHQLLEDNRALSSRTLRKYPAAARKTFSSDWSQQELDTVLFRALKYQVSSRPVCIFVDGLDEIDPTDEQFRVLELIDKLQAVPHLKICVSSRPEPIFKRRLSKYPMLRLQDLTKSDIRKYTSVFLRRHFEPNDEELWEFLDTVCRMADGVFLWVALVLKTLERGLSNDDSIDVLRQRLEVLPSDLHQLYQQMWRRLNDDERLYRKEAAMLFNAVLDGLAVSLHLTVAVAPLALDDSLVRRVLKDHTMLDADTWKDMQSATLNLLDVRCAGLLKVSGSIIAFIHRSAKDFFDTPQGQQILAHDERSLDSRLNQSYLAQLTSIRLQLCLEGTKPQIVHPASDFVGWIRHQLFRGRLSPDSALDLMHYCEDVYEATAWSYHGAPGDPNHPRIDFLSLAAVLGCDQFFFSAVERMPVARTMSVTYRSYLLSSIFTSPWSPPIQNDILDGRSRIATWLLEAGIDPNYRSINLDSLKYVALQQLNRLPPRRHLVIESTLLVYLFDLTMDAWGTLRSPVGYMNALLDCGARISNPALVILIIDGNAFHLFSHWNLFTVMTPNTALIVEANLGLLLSIYVKSQRNTVKTEEYPEFRRLSERISGVEASATLLGFALESQGQHQYLQPASADDSTFVLETLSNIRLDISEPGSKKYIIPDIVERLRGIAGHSVPSSHDEIEARLVANGLLVDAKEVKDWPPARFAP
ncbi:hypothetical protein QBC33DRAFT_286923 [Phialemonium atrogriseum]|uniref:Nephrocystin 3-like N-terminal domain-containing protein n=1 Tax=Phialemonium atrogriseum TaxID=1093897 RepID=A0AAJ0BQ03_9PEZI|nr:uncharacterized protein QBC33DRAFT_286923 [Phialemonium atrogriseum]KAK1762338.1 hypothetical protein QBC33DRAFT_286923 [Phialemonium atrogriseum]